MRKDIKSWSNEGVVCKIDYLFLRFDEHIFISGKKNHYFLANQIKICCNIAVSIVILASLQKNDTTTLSFKTAKGFYSVFEGEKRFYRTHKKKKGIIGQTLDFGRAKM